MTEGNDKDKTSEAESKSPPAVTDPSHQEADSMTTGDGQEKLAVEVAKLQNARDQGSADEIAGQLIDGVRNSELSWALDPKAGAEHNYDHEEQQDEAPVVEDEADGYQGLGKRGRRS